MSEKLPGKGLLGWLGRQVGHVTRAVRYDPESVAKKSSVEERRDPEHPDLVFRRTVTDEVRLARKGKSLPERADERP